MTARELPEGPAGKEAAAPAPPDDARRLREEIERTREHLGATVEQLAARADVKSRAQARAAELARQVTWQARSVAVQARKQAEHAGQLAVARAGSARGALTASSADARQKAIAAGPGAPVPARQPAAQGLDAARKRQVQLSAAAAAVGVLAVVAFFAWQRRKR
jgi:uncharacterized protein DUF3618